MSAPMLIPAADHYWSTLVRNDAEGAHAVVRRTLDLGVPVADALEGIVVHVQQRIGDSWAAAAWTVEQEHAATLISEEVVERVMADLPPPGPTRRPVLVACAERELHGLAGLVVTASLRSWGWPAEYLGPDTLPDVLAHRIAEVDPEAVLISASLSSSLTRVGHLVRPAARAGVPVVVGGAAFDRDGVRATRLGASAYAATPAAARVLLAGLPESLPLVVPPPSPRVPETIEAEVARLELQAEQLCREVLEQVIGTVDSPEEPEPDHWSVVLSTYAPHLVSSIAGGVLTDDPTVAASARAWLTGVMGRRGAPAGVTDHLWDGLCSRLGDFPATRALLAA